METATYVIFGLVYLGMILGEIPGLALDRTGVALLGAIGVVAFGNVTPVRAWSSVDMPTLYLLFAMMVVSAQFRLAGFYSHVARRLVAFDASPPALLGVVVIVSGLLSAVLTNDIVCLAMAPVLVDGCARRRIDPLPFLLALACSANVGSAATLIGNPQNILIGQALRLSFKDYLVDAGVPAAVGLGATWMVIALQFRGRWQREVPMPKVDAPPFDRWQTLKGLAITMVLIMAFLFMGSWPREGVALVCVGNPAALTTDGLPGDDVPRRLAAARPVHRSVHRERRVPARGRHAACDRRSAGTGNRPEPACGTVRSERRLVERRVQCAGNHAPLAQRHASAFGTHSRSIEHAGWKLVHRGLHREHHRRHRSPSARRHDRLPNPSPDRRPRDRGDARYRGRMALLTVGFPVKGSPAHDKPRQGPESPHAPPIR